MTGSHYPEALVIRPAQHRLRIDFLAGAFAAALSVAMLGCAGNTPAAPGGDTPKDLQAPCVGPKCVDPNGCDKESDCVEVLRPQSHGGLKRFARGRAVFKAEVSQSQIIVGFEIVRI